MANRQHIKPNRVLMARLYAACRPAMDMRARDSGDYLIETPDSAGRGSTLGSSLEEKPEQA